MLVSPLRPAERFSDLTQAEIADLFTTVQKVSNVIQRKYGGTSLTVAVQDGPDAGQTVKVSIKSIVKCKINVDRLFVKLLLYFPVDDISVI